MADSSVPPASGSSGSSSSDSSTATDNALTSLDVNQFLSLMITELQNQDPLNPTDNEKILDQIGIMRQITSSDSLSKTLDSVLLGQNLTSASSMIGKNISALDDNANDVTGVVDRVTVTDGTPKLQIGDSTVSLNNIKEILPAAS
jgi:flagellar basal-body rod modification protein FlgD